MLTFEVFANGIAWFDSNDEFLSWFRTWPDALAVIGTLRPESRFRVSGSPEVVYLPR